MNPRERFLASLRGEEFDRRSVGNFTSLATVGQMKATGAYFPEVHLDAEKMALLASAGHDILGFDTVAPYFSAVQEAAALGCEVNWGRQDMMPDLKNNPYRDPSDFRLPPDFLDRPSTRTVIEAIRLLRKKCGDRVAVVGKVMGPWTLSYHLHGVQNFLISVILDPAKVRGFLEVLKEVSVLFANAQVEAGADVIVLADHAGRDLVGPDTYRDFLLPVHKEVVPRIAAPVILHMCGDTADRFGYIAEAGFAAFHFDSKVDARKACELARGRLRLVGNINNPRTLLFGSPEDVRRETFYALEAGVDVVGPECAIPLRTPDDNLKAIVGAVREYYGISA